MKQNMIFFEVMNSVNSTKKCDSTKNSNDLLENHTFPECEPDIEAGYLAGTGLSRILPAGTGLRSQPDNRSDPSYDSVFSDVFY